MPFDGSNAQGGSHIEHMGPAAQSTPVPSSRTNQISHEAAPHAQNTPANIDFGHDDDPIMPSYLQNAMVQIQSRIDPELRRRLDRLSQSLNAQQVDRIQSNEATDSNNQPVDGGQQHAVSADPDDAEVVGVQADSHGQPADYGAVAADPSGPQANRVPVDPNENDGNEQVGTGSERIIHFINTIITPFLFSIEFE